jgi:hypothetical protein
LLSGPGAEDSLLVLAIDAGTGRKPPRALISGTLVEGGFADYWYKTAPYLCNFLLHWNRKPRLIIFLRYLTAWVSAKGCKALRLSPFVIVNCTKT